MEQDTPDETGRRALGAVRSGLRRALGLDPLVAAPELEHPVAMAHGTWQVCGVSRPPDETGPAGLRRR